MKLPKKVVYVISAVAAAIVLFFVFLLSPLFHISEVIITGNMRTPDEEIIGRMQVDETTNLVFFRSRGARQRLKQNFFIAAVTFRREIPNILHVHIDERRLMAYAEHMGLFLYLDDFARVVDIRSYKSEPRPLLVGLNIRSFQMGERLDIPNTIALNAIVHYSLLLYHHGLIDRVAHMDVSDTNNIRILIGYWEFNVGGVLGADEKIRYIIAMLEAMPYEGIMRGFTDLRGLGPQFIFEILQ